MPLQGLLFDEVNLCVVKLTVLTTMGNLFPNDRVVVWYIAKMYNKLGVTKNANLDIYLVVFLCYWLCVFVFPSINPKYLQLETFKMDNLTTFGKKILNLAIPMLVKIYQGLNKITCSTRVGSYNACFPVHYVLG